ncbi:MAG TPA: hypothetical protein VM938_14750 [Acidimicrobiales bacterium]|nr:hypothetical protein [Acidimicrobiales bacterium]
MDPAAAELSSLATALEELTSRLTGLADGFMRARREDIGAEIFAVERLLDTARRRLDKVVDTVSA